MPALSKLNKSAFAHVQLQNGLDHTVVASYSGLYQVGESMSLPSQGSIIHKATVAKVMDASENDYKVIYHISTER